MPSPDSYKNLSLVTEVYKLWCRCNFNYWIAARLEWKSITPSDPSQTGQVSRERDSLLVPLSKGCRQLGQLDLEITLTKQLPEGTESSILSQSTMINGRALTDDAFLPKSFAVKIEQGNFIEPCVIGFPASDRPRFALRLLFDKSPYPPRSEWKQPEGGPDGGQFWDHREFVSRESPDLKKHGKAVTDSSASSGWRSCTVC